MRNHKKTDALTENEEKKVKKFKELYLDGEIELEEIDDFVDRWNFSDETCTLREYLGLNEEEEDAWISDSEEALFALLRDQKNFSISS